MTTPDSPLLAVVLASWERHNRVLLNLVSAVPRGGLDARALPGSPSVSAMFAHMHHERVVSVLENVPEAAGEVPAQEWASGHSAVQLAEMLDESGRRVRDAVKARVDAGTALDRDFAHPIHLIQFLIFHEGYHHGQIKLALKASGCPIADEQAGPLTWQVWRARTEA